MRSDVHNSSPLTETLDRVANDPFAAPNIAPLKGEFTGLYRVRVGEYRVVIEIRAKTREIFVLAMDVRGNIYKS